MTTQAREHYGRGKLHAQHTLDVMRKNIIEATAEPLCWETARDIAADVARSDQQAQALAVRQWVSAHYRYVNDPVKVELLETPGYLLSRIRARGYALGDCDAGASITAALCSALGIQVELWAVAFAPNAGFQHVFAVAFPKVGAPVELDVSRPTRAPMPHKFPRRLRLRV